MGRLSKRLAATCVLHLTIALIADGTVQAQVSPTSAKIKTPPVSREAELEARLRKMEMMNQQMAEQFDAVAKENKALVEQNKAFVEQFKLVAEQNKKILEKVDNLTVPTVGTSSADAKQGDQNGKTSSPDDQPPDIRTDEPEPKSREKATRSFFDEGFKWETKDSEFTLNFHNETQLDTRVYEQRGSTPVNQTGFYIPRMRLYFNGRLTKPIEYSIAVNKGLGFFDLLDAYLNFNYDKRFQIRIGRYRAPFTYDFYALSNQFLTTPERSLFAINYGYNRNVGVMGHGELFDERVDYAVGGFNGPRNSYFDSNGSKDLLAYVNARPFEHSERWSALKHLNLGGSVAYGLQDQIPLPADFRTFANASDSPGQFNAGPSFLQLNNGVTEKGRRELWELHLAYYYKQLSVIAAYDRGFNDYSPGTGADLVHLPVSSYHVATGYFLTGEQVERRTFVEPIHPFDLRKGKVGTGAIELQARFDDFALGKQVFTGGLADPNLWTNHVYAIDSGVNWYLNKYVKIYFDWQHSVYAQPIYYRPGGLQKTSDLFWLRCQIYF